MGWDCPCGTSVGTSAHWCEWLQEQHAHRVEALLGRIGDALDAGPRPPVYEYGWMGRDHPEHPEGDGLAR